MRSRDQSVHSARKRLSIMGRRGNEARQRNWRDSYQKLEGCSISKVLALQAWGLEADPSETMKKRKTSTAMHT